MNIRYIIFHCHQCSLSSPRSFYTTPRQYKVYRSVYINLLIAIFNLFCFNFADEQLYFFLSCCVHMITLCTMLSLFFLLSYSPLFATLISYIPPHLFFFSFIHLSGAGPRRSRAKKRALLKYEAIRVRSKSYLYLSYLVSSCPFLFICYLI